MSHYHHLTLQDRVHISALTISGKSLSEIACAIGKNVSTISRELKRNKASLAQNGASAAYDPCAAQVRYQRQRKHCGRRNILKSDPLLTVIVSNLLVKKFWSPEQIQHRLSKGLPNLRISATTIYRGIYSGFLDRFVEGRKMSRHLRHHGKTRHRKGMFERRGKIQITHTIEERLQEVQNRSRLGDWEGDTVIGKKGGACLTTLVDRISGFLCGGKTASKTAADVSAVIEKSLSDKDLRTITVDRGKEFSWAEKLEKDLKTKVYFCLPHHPWEKGSNENTNGLLRDFFPKGVSIDKISQAEVQKRFNALNFRPRKRLNWKCPAEVFYSVTLHLI